VWVDQNTARKYIPLTHIEGGRFEVRDSPLSEFGVLGYEYGYSIADPRTLVLWEAQFGDFANGAQVIIDQFIAAGEAKWLRASGLVMLLPHGYEGQGPEHSSARPERYLQLCAEDNMQVANCTTPANYFHILRRQMLRDFRKPLVIVTPKSLLRHKLAVSAAADFTGDSHFQRLLSDPSAPRDEDVRRLVLCSGKVAYDLIEARDQAGDRNTAIVRVEQLYPFPSEPLAARLKRMTNLEEVVWAQEEPKNGGYWTFVEPFVEQCLLEADVKPKRPVYAGRPAAASPATGLAKRHALEQAALIAKRLATRPRPHPSGKPDKKEDYGDRCNRTDAGGIDHRSDARPVAEAAGRSGEGRRADRQPRDRQGGRRSALARGGQDGGACRERRRHRCRRRADRTGGSRCRR
jgi:2-oxoglutarate dehydrogenase E1 component